MRRVDVRTHDARAVVLGEEVVIMTKPRPSGADGRLEALSFRVPLADVAAVLRAAQAVAPTERGG